jgi:hypothetical protein
VYTIGFCFIEGSRGVRYFLTCGEDMYGIDIPDENISEYLLECWLTVVILLVIIYHME